MLIKIIKGIVLINFGLYLYNTLMTIFSFKKYEKPRSMIDSFRQTFSILIPSHNEEDVIYDTLQNIQKIKYPKDYFNVYIIMDNCTDNTLKEFNRFKQDYPFSTNINKIIVNGGSKPKALNKAISYLKENNLWKSDNIIILDADNIISDTMLESYDYYHKMYNDILQCRILSANDNNIISQGFTSSFNFMAYGFQYTRNCIGLSASLSGTGFSIKRDIFDKVGFNKCDTLTEDLEFSILCILNGYKIKYVPEEYVLNQHLESFKPSLIQRIRWCRGHMQTAMKLDKSLLKAFIKRPSFQLIDSFIFLNSPPKFIIYLIANINLLLLNIKIIPLWVLILLFAYNTFYVLRCNGYKLKYFIPHFWYSITMQISLLIGTVTYKNKQWVKTVHKKL